MAITHVLLQSNFNSNIQQSFPTKWSCDAHLTRINYSCRYNVVVTASTARTRMKCVTMNHHKITLDVENDHALRTIDTGCDINEAFWRSVEEFFKALQKPVIIGVMIFLSLIFCFDQQRDALAATGGRMGGRSFSSSSSSGSSSRSSSSSSRNYSSPSSSSSSSTRSSSPKSSSSESYSTPRSSSSSSYSSTKSSSPKPSYSDESYSRPRSYSSRSYSSPKSSNSVNYSTQVGTLPSENAKKLERKDVFWIVTVVSIICLIVYLGTRPESDSVQDTAKSSVIKLQVGLLGTARSLQKDLNKIAETADTSNPKGLSNILQETTAALLRHSGYCISSYSSVDVKRGATESEKRFNQLSIEERNKFDEETLVNVDNIKKQTASSSTANEACSEYIVVTIIVAAEGILYLPPIKSDAELKKALQKLASISSSNIMAAEVLWTPQEENDCLTEKELLEDYPQLRPL